jgi:uncharacterized protein (TIRG00374 family)
MKIKTFLKNEKILKIIISLLILVFLLKLVNFQMLFNSLKSVNSLFLLVLILIPISILLRAWRWSIILNKDTKLVSIEHSFVLTLVGIALNIFLPANMGDVGKSYYGYKWHGIKEEMLSSSLIDKFIALLSVFIIGTITSFYLKLYLLSIFSLILTSIFLLIVFFPKIMPWNLLNRILALFIKKELDEKILKSSFELENKIKFYAFLISIIAFIP